MKKLTNFGDLIEIEMEKLFRKLEIVNGKKDTYKDWLKDARKHQKGEK